jgi:uncharacterized membrane protein
MMAFALECDCYAGNHVLQFAAPKGTLPHRTVGWIWVGLMLVVSLTSFWIHELRIWGPWSPIHLLSIATLATVPLAVWHARRHAVQHHRWSMISIFTGALVVAGLFAGPDHARGRIRELSH